MNGQVMVTERLSSPEPCYWHACSAQAFCRVGEYPLCRTHACRRLSRDIWDAKIAALVDFVRAHGFEDLEMVPL